MENIIEYLNINFDSDIISFDKNSENKDTCDNDYIYKLIFTIDYKCFTLYIDFYDEISFLYYGLLCAEYNQNLIIFDKDFSNLYFLQKSLHKNPKINIYNIEDNIDYVNINSILCAENSINFEKSYIEPTNLIEFLNKYNLDYTKLTYNKSVISGSIVLSSVLNEWYDNSDIDVFCEKNNSNYIITYLTSIGSLLMEDTYQFDYSDRLTSIKYKYNGIVINVIIIDIIKNIINTIEKTFDFSFCMCIFDGEKIIYPSDIKNKYSKIYNTNFKGVFLYDYLKILINQYKRCIKYTVRGFKIEGIEYNNVVLW